MRRRILDFLVCPDCRARFQLEEFSEEAGRIKEGLLKCESCQSNYPITDFIPRFIKEQEGGRGLSAPEELNQRTRRSFGYQWTRRKFCRIIPQFEDDFLNYVYPLDREFFRGKVGVDIGCGFGRHIYYAAEFGAEMFGIDFSSAIDSAYSNTKELSNIHLIQADIYHLPLKNNSFDFIYSIGVLHHLPEPEKGFNAILLLLKSKGEISIWVYSKSRPVVNFTIEAVRLITKRMPHNLLYVLCVVLSALEWLLVIMPYRILHKVSFITAILEKIAFRRIKIYAVYSFDVLCADWFDRLSAPIRNYYNENELRDWFTRAGLNIVKISPTRGYGWRVWGKKE